MSAVAWIDVLVLLALLGGGLAGSFWTQVWMRLRVRRLAFSARRPPPRESCGLCDHARGLACAWCIDVYLGDRDRLSP